MGWKLGIILFASNLKQIEEAIVTSFVSNARKSTKVAGIDEVFSSSFRDIAIGYYHDTTILVNPVIPYEFTSDLHYIGKSISFSFLENLSYHYDILCVHLHSSAGIYGHCIFSMGKRKIAVYKSDDDIILSYDASAKETEIKRIQDWYSEKFIIGLIETFLKKSFSVWMSDKKMTFTLYDIP